MFQTKPTRPQECKEKWAVSTTIHRDEAIVEVSVSSTAKIKLTDSAYIDKSFLDSDSLLLAPVRKNVRWQGFLVTVTNSKNFMLNGENLKVYLIEWMNEDLGYPEFSNSVLYCKRYGMLFKSFRKMGKEWYRWRLIDTNCGQKNSSAQLSDFTNMLVKDPAFFPQPAKRKM